MPPRKPDEVEEEEDGKPAAKKTKRQETQQVNRHGPLQYLVHLYGALYPNDLARPYSLVHESVIFSFEDGIEKIPKDLQCKEVDAKKELSEDEERLHQALIEMHVHMPPRKPNEVEEEEDGKPAAKKTKRQGTQQVKVRWSKCGGQSAEVKVRRSKCGGQSAEVGMCWVVLSPASFPQ